VIPSDCWHEPFVSRADLTAEIADGRLLRTYWSIPARQRETSVVLVYSGEPD